MAKYTGTGAIKDTDYKVVQWVGKTKAGAAVKITLPKAINMGNIDWTFAEKDDTVPSVVFTAVYDNTDAAATSEAEPFEVEFATDTKASGDIMLGAGVFYVGDSVEALNKVALTRGGGQFTVEREYREVNADGDRGPVAGRITIDASRATLTMNVLTMLTKFADLYPALDTVSE